MSARDVAQADAVTVAPERPEAPAPWLMTMDPRAVRARVAIVLGSNVVLLGAAWLLAPH